MVPRPEEQPRLARVLLVEDDVLVRLMIADELREAGLTVIEAASADEALAYLGAGGHADLVFTDIEMPGTMNGLEMARHLRAWTPSLPLILTSGKFMPQNVGSLGLFIAKPYSVDRAVQLVLEQLGPQQPNGEE
jgi:two-component system, response regulator PdtaR